ncbi:MAG: urease accessory UreF family protein [Acidimicrobiales bacterium]|nr:urease accessory UreF family protein [Acidimicrobiales bacterium]
MSTPLAALLLADGRLPTGGHVHSAGVESAVADGRIVDVETLGAYLLGRLHTVGLTEAALAAAVVRQPESIERLDAEANARITVPELRVVSRRLGRQLVRVASRCWPDPVLATLPADPHQPVALGAVGIAAGLDAITVARLAIHHATATPAQGALRLLGLDPFAIAMLTASLAVVGEQVAIDAVIAASGPIEDLPARTGPVVEIAAATHATLTTRLFAS